MDYILEEFHILQLIISVVLYKEVYSFVKKKKKRKGKMKDERREIKVHETTLYNLLCV